MSAGLSEAQRRAFWSLSPFFLSPLCFRCPFPDLWTVRLPDGFQDLFLSADPLPCGMSLRDPDGETLNIYPARCLWPEWSDHWGYNSGRLLILGPNHLAVFRQFEPSPCQMTWSPESGPDCDPVKHRQQFQTRWHFRR